MFKAGVVRLVLDEGKTVGKVARDLDLTDSAVRAWVERARADRGKGKPGVLTSEEREEPPTHRPLCQGGYRLGREGRKW